MNTQYLQTSEGRLAFDDAGRGPLVVGVPSMGDQRAEYRFLAPPLVSAGYRAVQLDVRGHGESSAGWPDYSVGAIGSDLVALVRHLNAGPAVVVGTSMAAGAAVWAAAEAPESVRGLVLIGPFVRGGGDLFGRALSSVFSGPWGPALWLRYYSTLYPSRKPADFAEYSAALAANLKEPGRREALGQMIRASKEASEVRLSRVAAPAMVIMGRRDPDFKDPAAEARWVAERLHARCEMIDGAGHYPHAEMPEETGRLILSFLQTLKGAPDETQGA